LRRFLQLPWQIYRGNPHWVPPLLLQQKRFFDRRRNPFFEHADSVLFLLEKGGTTLGRIGACVDQNHISFHKEKVGFFGFFECVDDDAAAAELLAAASAFLREQGMEGIRGPMSFTTNHECALLVEGFDSPPAVMMPYNPPYYARLLESCGLAKAKDLLAYWLTAAPLPEKFIRVAQAAIERESIAIRCFDPASDHDRAVIRDIYNAAWSENWGFIPLTEKEFNHMAADMEQILDPDFLLIGKVRGEPAGFSLMLPDLNQALIHLNGRLFPFGLFKLLWYKRRINRGRLLLMAVKKEHRLTGLDAVFYWKTFQTGLRKGYVGAELSWVLEDNLMMNRILQRMGAQVVKRYRIYEKRL